MRFQWDWLRRALCVPYVPTLGPVHPAALSAELPRLRLLNLGMTSTAAPASQAMNNTRSRTRWGELPGTVRRALESAASPVRDVEPISAGLNCGIAALLHTSNGRVFIKGLRSDHPRVATQRREARINPYVAPIAPRLLWQIDTAGWTILVFEHLEDRHANLTPDSADLPKIAYTLRQLGHIQAPDLQLRGLDDRWAGLVDDATLHLLAGKLHPSRLRALQRGAQNRDSFCRHRPSLRLRPLPQPPERARLSLRHCEDRCDAETAGRVTLSSPGQKRASCGKLG
ncbi:MAG: hypothetical protein ACRDRX_25425 [Pseudonocardiaceae bacterium]